jgi:type II secretory pathway pseudopilin PulG
MMPLVRTRVVVLVALLVALGACSHQSQAARDQQTRHEQQVKDQQQQQDQARQAQIRVQAAQSAVQNTLSKFARCNQDHPLPDMPPPHASTNYSRMGDPAYLKQLDQQNAEITQASAKYSQDLTRIEGERLGDPDCY